MYGAATIRNRLGTTLTSSAVGNPWLFTGREFDPESGLYHYRARGYDPSAGRFLQRDPAGVVDGLNLRVYVRMSPACFRDPKGKYISDTQLNGPRTVEEGRRAAEESKKASEKQKKDLEKAREEHKKKEKDADYLLRVHLNPPGTDDKRDYGHAWVELIDQSDPCSTNRLARGKYADGRASAVNKPPASIAPEGAKQSKNQIVFILTKEQYEKAKEFIENAERDAEETYQAMLDNRSDFVKDVAEAAGREVKDTPIGPDTPNSLRDANAHRPNYR